MWSAKAGLEKEREMKDIKEKEWSKRVMFKFVRGRWISSVVCKPGEYFTPHDRKMLERELRLTWREYQREQMLENKEKARKDES